MANAFDTQSGGNGMGPPPMGGSQGGSSDLQAAAEALLPYLLPLILQALGGDVQSGPGPSPYGGPPPAGALGSPQFGQ